MEIGYHASHEQFAPDHLLNLVIRAEKAGFRSILSSDHFHPWSEEQGHSGFAWSWLGAAMQATSLNFGIVNAPGQRYHPAIIAQAAATLEVMFPKRFWLAQGSGQYLNEHITGERWPQKELRNARLKESVEMMRKLWTGKLISQKGLVTVEDARLYTIPETPPPIIGAAITPKTAAWIAPWADGMITVSLGAEKQKEVLKAFRDNGGEHKPVYLKVQLSYDKSVRKARDGAHTEWRNNIFDSAVLSDLKHTQHFDMVGSKVRAEQMHDAVRISSSITQHIDWISEDISLGYAKIILHNVNRFQEEFIDTFGAKVLSEF